MRPGRRLRMELGRAGAQLGIREAFDRAVVELAVRYTRVVAGSDCKAVVLRRDDHGARAVIDHRVIRTAVAERELERLLAGGERKQLVAETDPEDRRASEQRLQLPRLMGQRGRVARS